MVFQPYINKTRREKNTEQKRQLVVEKKKIKAKPGNWALENISLPCKQSKTLPAWRLSSPLNELSALAPNRYSIPRRLTSERLMTGSGVRGWG
jgi:hypothetical protein